ncbi:hypothetical protein BKA80DRAFT_120195 [Phyllosticta citrichinensis]
MLCQLSECGEEWDGQHVEDRAWTETAAAPQRTNYFTQHVEDAVSKKDHGGQSTMLARARGSTSGRTQAEDGRWQGRDFTPFGWVLPAGSSHAHSTTGHGVLMGTKALRLHRNRSKFADLVCESAICSIRSLETRIHWLITVGFPTTLFVEPCPPWVALP